MSNGNNVEAPLQHQLGAYDAIKSFFTTTTTTTTK